MFDNPSADARLPPADIQAELSLLGTLLANNKAFSDVAEFLRPEHFADRVNAHVYSAIGQVIARGDVADAVTLRNEFEGTGKLDEVGGTPYLAKLLSHMVSVNNAAGYGRIIYENWVRRAAIDAAAKIADLAFTGGTDVRDMISSGIAALENTLIRGGAKSLTVLEAVDLAVAAGQRAAAGHINGVMTGLPSLDKRLRGMEGGMMYVLAGRPGMGKSALALRIGLNAALAGTGVCMISLEMNGPQLGRRALADLASVPIFDLKDGKWSEAAAARIVRAREQIANLPFTIDDQNGLSVPLIALKARAAKRRHGLGLLIVDHLHIVGKDGVFEKRGDTTGAIGQISNGLKRLAKELGIPVLALAQLKRIEGREDKRPTMEDLKQSGEIEQDAEVVMMIYREDYYLGNSPPPPIPGKPGEQNANRASQWEASKKEWAGKAEVIFSKVRDGVVGTEIIGFNGALTRFYELEPSAPEPILGPQEDDYSDTGGMFS